MNKLIIDNRTELTDLEAITLVGKVIEKGRISNDGNQYCCGTEITIEDKEYMIWTYLNKKSDRFVITTVSKRFAIAAETTDNIVKGKKYELIEAESMGYYIIDESGEETYYHRSSLHVC